MVKDLLRVSSSLFVAVCAGKCHSFVTGWLADIYLVTSAPVDPVLAYLAVNLVRGRSIKERG